MNKIDESGMNADEKIAEGLAVVVRVCVVSERTIDDALLSLLR